MAQPTWVGNHATHVLSAVHLNDINKPEIQEEQTDVEPSCKEGIW